MHAETYDGREVQVVVQPNLEHITPEPESGLLLVPDTFSWLPLDEAEETSLVERPRGHGARSRRRRRRCRP